MAMTPAEKQAAYRARQAAKAAEAKAAGGAAAETAVAAETKERKRKAAVATNLRSQTASKGQAAAGAAVGAAATQQERVQVTGRTRRSAKSGSSTWSAEEAEMVPASMVAGKVKGAGGTEVSLGVPTGANEVTTTHLTRATQTAAAPPANSPTAGFVDVSTRSAAEKAARADKGLPNAPVVTARGAGGYYTQPKGAAREGQVALDAREREMIEAGNKLVSVHIPSELHRLANNVASGKMTADEARDAHEELKGQYPKSYGRAVADASSGFDQAHEALHKAYGQYRVTEDRIARAGTTLSPRGANLSTAGFSREDLAKIDAISGGDLSGGSVTPANDKIYVTPADLQRASRGRPRLGPVDTVRTGSSLGLVHAYGSGLADPVNGGRRVVAALRDSGHDMSLDPSKLPIADDPKDVDINQTRLDAIEDQATDKVMSHPLNKDLAADVAGTAQHGEANFLVAHAKKNGLGDEHIGSGTANDIAKGALSEHIRRNVVGVSQKHLGETDEPERAPVQGHGLPVAPEGTIATPKGSFKSTATGTYGYGASDEEYEHFGKAAASVQSRLLTAHATSASGASLTRTSEPFERSYWGARAAASNSPRTSRLSPGPALTPEDVSQMKAKWSAPQPTPRPTVNWVVTPSHSDTATDAQSIRAREVDRLFRARISNPPEGDPSQVKVEKPQWLQQRESGQTPDIEQNLPGQVRAQAMEASTSAKRAQYHVANALAGRGPSQGLPPGNPNPPTTLPGWAHHAAAAAGAGELTGGGERTYQGGVPRTARALERVTPGRMTSESRRKPGLAPTDVTPEALALAPGVPARPAPNPNAPKVSGSQVRSTGGRTQLGGIGEGRVKNSFKHQFGRGK